MKTLCGLSVALILSAGLFAQNRSGFVRTGPIVRSFPGVNFPGGSSALPGVQRSIGGVVFPGGGTQIGVPGIRYNPGNVFHNGDRGLYGGHGQGERGWGRGAGYGNGVGAGYAYPVAVPVPVPVYGGNGYEDPSAYAQEYGPAPAAAAPMAPQAPPNVIIIYPQGPAPGYGMPPTPPQALAPQTAPAEAGAQPADSGETPTHYLIALKDHSIYSAVAYWVDGDTLHYFTNGNTQNEVSLALVDRDLTRKLNDQSGLQLNLPPAR